MALPYCSLVQSYVRGSSFADVGGLWNTENEMVSVAIKGGAARTSMIDMQPEGNEWWEKFDARCQALGVSGYSKVVGSIDDPELIKQAGVFDFVHCSGVIYHCPNPVWTIRQLRKMTKRFLLLNSMTIPGVITNAAGEIRLDTSQCLYVPAMTAKQLAVLNERFQQLGMGRIFDNQNWWFDTGANYSPWWWLWSIDTLAGLVKSCGFRIIETGTSWTDRAHFVLAEKT